MTTYVLIHGAGDVGWSWHLLEQELRERGHDVVTMDLPADDESAGLSVYADTVIEAIGDRTGLVLVAQSFGGYTAPLVADRLPVDLMVFIAGMVPAPGESAGEMFANTGYEQDPAHSAMMSTPEGLIEVFMPDVPPDLAAEAMAKGRDQADAPFQEPWPLDAWPNVPVRYLLCTNDRLFPPDWTRRVVQDRLGIIPDEIESGHCPALSRPKELASHLESFVAELSPHS